MVNHNTVLQVFYYLTYKNYYNYLAETRDLSDNDLHVQHHS